MSRRPLSVKWIVVVWATELHAAKTSPHVEVPSGSAHQITVIVEHPRVLERQTWISRIVLPFAEVSLQPRAVRVNLRIGAIGVECQKLRAKRSLGHVMTCDLRDLGFATTHNETSHENHLPYRLGRAHVRLRTTISGGSQPPLIQELPLT